MTQRGRDQGRGSGGRGGGGGRDGSRRHFPRVARINEVLREVIAEELEQIDDEALGLVTVTGVTADPDLRNATVWFSALNVAGGVDGVLVALAGHRVQLQAAIGRQVSFKRTPHLLFKADPAITEGLRIEEVLRDMPRSTPEAEAEMRAAELREAELRAVEEREAEAREAARSTRAGGRSGDDDDADDAVDDPEDDLDDDLVDLARLDARPDGAVDAGAGGDVDGIRV